MNTTITPTPRAQFIGQLSARTWNMLTRHGLADLTLIRQAIADGLKPGDYKGLGQVALMEIKLALDALPEKPPEPAEQPRRDSSPASVAEILSTLSQRELTLIIELAEAGMDHLGPEYSVTEAESALLHLRQVKPAAEPSAPEQPEMLIKGSTWQAPVGPLSSRPDPEPLDDNFEGYVIEPKPGWGQF